MSTAIIGAPEFRARSGRKVQVRENGTVTFDHANGYLSPESAMDAEEFFLAQRDSELGRWRCPTDLDWVAKEGDRDSYGRRTVLLFNERTFETHHLNTVVIEDDGLGQLVSEYPKHRVARAFFEAHPGRPAAGAKAGEVWELTIDDGSEHTVFVHADRTTGGRDGISAGGAYFDIDDASNVVSARKVWGPEDAS